jgi:hypothetical protein
MAAAIPSTVLLKAPPKIEVWMVNMGKSTFSSTAGTLVLEQRKAAPDVDAKGYPAAHQFLLLSSGKLYLATDGGTSADRAANAAYSRWAGMKLSQIGQVTTGYDCGFRCQFGLADKRPTTMRIVFMTTP